MHFLYRLILAMMLVGGIAGCQTSADPPTPTPTSPAATVAPASTTIPASPVAPTVAATPIASSPTVAPASVPPTATPAPVAVGLPLRLQIPRLGVDAAIEQVGKDEVGRMDVPQAVENVAWYTPGARPGATGSAVMAGHLDNYLQQPAVFWGLNDLQVGDTVTVVDDTGATHHFTVTGMETYGFDNAPIAKIFGDEGVTRLNLITCRGEWDSTAENYNERLVVYTELVEGE